MPNINRPRQGYTLPGYKYLGPGNTLDHGEPTNQSDKAAKKHDQHYHLIQQAEHNPYLYFNEADRTFIEETEKATDWGGWLGNKAFKLKPAIAPNLEHTRKKQKTNHPSQTVSKKRPAPRHIFINQAKKRRVLGSKAKENMDNNTPDSMEEETAFSSEPGKPATAGGGGGASKSTGNYNNTTEWKFIGDEVIITCNASRHIILNEAPNDQYTLQITKDKDKGTTSFDSMTDNGCAQILTPWFLLDHNAWGVWMSPHDFTHMAMICKHIQLLDLEREIFNISLKTVTETATLPA
ncbi:uncharacterized protein [Notamacropus eugenii]|uniref:uncharacterized protein n=1 Tax=Notamacropus eugenii TaxID=9315 RepID=UPI003B685527